MRFKIILAGLALFLIFANLQAGWERQFAAPNHLNSIDFPPNNTSVGFACGDSSLLLRTVDGGERWEIMLVLPSDNFHDINFPVNESIGYIACDLGNVQKTTDGGEVWEIVNTGSPVSLYGLHFPNNIDVGYAVGDDGTIKVTRDGGLGWEDFPAPIPVRLNDVYFVNTMVGYVVGAEGNVFYTFDGGQTWEPRSTGLEEQLLGVYFHDDTTGWVVGEGRILLKTTNAGGEWTRLQIPGPTITNFHSVIFPTGVNTGFVCGTDGLVAKTTDGGRTWQITELGEVYDLHCIEFPQDDLIGWICGSEGIIFKTIDGGIGIKENNLNRALSGNSFSCSPNPFRTNTTIKYNHPVKGQTILKVYDAKGELVRRLTLNKNGKVSWDGKNEQNQRVDSGIYFIELAMNASSAQSIKLVVLD